ncbi:hypothetical protein [Methyloversatilis thermotolerans]|uniref:hypothetical protein n=1 Tax=Methyloversatilis thermotolerans TaxID=1346290 RepID=UPI00039B60B8|nr:hypothetical protein [Methyloversatilis thermotolerans]
MSMTVKQLIAALQDMPADATVLLEGDAGYSPLGALEMLGNGGGLPDEVVLQPDMTPD